MNAVGYISLKMGSRIPSITHRGPPGKSDEIVLSSKIVWTELDKLRYS